MGRSALQSIFDLIEMHAHLATPTSDPGPQLTFAAEKDLLEEVMWLRSCIVHQLGWALPIPALPAPEVEPEPESEKGSIHERARQFLEANAEEAAYWKRMNNRTSEEILANGPIPFEVQVRSALWELRKKRAAGATDEEAVAALFWANSVDDLGVLKILQDTKPKEIRTLPKEAIEEYQAVSNSIPQSGMSSWGDNPGSSEPKPHGLVTDSEGRITDSEGFPHFWGSEAEPDEPEQPEETEQAEQTSCGEVDASDFTGPQSITIPLDPVEEVRAAIQEAHKRGNEYASVPITVARMVHYVSYGTPGGEYGSECRAAVVSGVRANDFYPQLADLVVLNPTGLFFNSKSLQSEAEYLGGTWHYPMQCRNNGALRDSRE
jgi:hypothetical protein